MEASKWLLDFRAVFLFCDFFFFPKRQILCTYRSRIHPEDLQTLPRKYSSSCRNLAFHSDASGTPKSKKCHGQAALARGNELLQTQSSALLLPCLYPSQQSLTARIEVNPGCWMLHVFFKSPISLLGSQSPLHDVASRFLLSAF